MKYLLPGVVIGVCYVIGMVACFPLDVAELQPEELEAIDDGFERMKRQASYVRNPDGSITATFANSQSFGNAAPGANVAGNFGFSETVTFGGRPGSSRFSNSGTSNFGLTGNIGGQSFGNTNTNSHSNAQGQGPTGFGAANANSVGNSNFSNGPGGNFNNANTFSNANSNLYNRPRGRPYRRY